jgi:hypothetical protein
MAIQTTGLDSALALDATYYSAPIPRNAAVLTILGAVFDKVYFPGVYMPKGGYDSKELQKEIERLKALPTPGAGTGQLIGMLEFVRHVKTLDGFCVFTGDRDDPFLDRNKVPGDMVRDLFFAIHGPQKAGWEPVFDTNHHKGLPGSDEHVTWPGDYHYLANSVIESANTGTSKHGKTRIDSSCRKCGALNRVSADQGQVRVLYRCKECGEQQKTL